MAGGASGLLMLGIMASGCDAAAGAGSEAATAGAALFLAACGAACAAAIIIAAINTDNVFFIGMWCGNRNKNNRVVRFGTKGSHYTAATSLC